MPRRYDADFVIYGLSCVCHPAAGVRYVGQTRMGARRRLNGHLSDARRGKALPVYHWIRKHGESNIQAKVLEQCSDELDLDDAECAWITSLATRGSLLNIKPGGLTHSWAESSKAKLSQSLKRAYSEGRKDNRSEKNPRYGVSVSAETRAKIIAALPDLKGSANPHSKLTELQVRSIHAAYKSGVITQAALAQMYEVDQVCISQIARGEVWAHLNLDPIRHGKGASGADNSMAVLEESAVREIHARYAQGGTRQSDLAKRYGVSQATISGIVSGKTWLHLDLAPIAGNGIRWAK